MARKLVQDDSGDILNLENAITIRLNIVDATAHRKGDRFWSIYVSSEWSPDSISESSNPENFKAVELWVKRNMISGAVPVRDEKGRFRKEPKPTAAEKPDASDTNGI